MNTLSLVNPLMFVFGIVLGFLFRNSIFIHIERETRERTKMMEVMDAKLRKLRSEFEEAVDASEEAASQAEDELKEDQTGLADVKESLTFMMNAFDASLKRIETLEKNNEEMKSLVGYLNTAAVTNTQFTRAFDDVVTYVSLKNMLEEFKESLVTRSEVQDFVTAEKAASMVFQSEAIQRRRVKAALETKMSDEIDVASRVEAGVKSIELSIRVAKAAATVAEASAASAAAAAAASAGSAAVAEVSAVSAATAPTASVSLKEPEYYQGWMASAELNGIKAEVEICNTQIRTKAENKAWLDDESADAVQNRELLMQPTTDGWKGWAQAEANQNEYSKRTYKAGEWSTGVKTEIKLTFPPPPPRVGDLPPPPPRDGKVCYDIATKLIPLLTWERVLLAVDSV